MHWSRHGRCRCLGEREGLILQSSLCDTVHISLRRAMYIFDLSLSPRASPSRSTGPPSAPPWVLRLVGAFVASIVRRAQSRSRLQVNPSILTLEFAGEPYSLQWSDIEVTEGGKAALRRSWRRRLARLLRERLPREHSRRLRGQRSRAQQTSLRSTNGSKVTARGIASACRADQTGSAGRQQVVLSVSACALYCLLTSASFLQPFPLNPAFKPLPPLPDTLKTRIYNAFIYNIENHPNVTSDAQVVRAVAAKFGVAMDRVRAIVRLKELEKTMRAEGKPVESNFQKGMEAHLGVKAAASENWRGIEAPDAGRGSRVSQASHKTVFEFVDAEQGDKPVLPLLDKLPTRSRTDEAGQRRQVERDSTSIYPPARPGRPATLFRDLSGTPEGIALETTYSVKGKRTRRAGANRRSLETDVLDKYGVTVRSAMDGAVRKQATDPRHRAQLVAEAIARASEKGQEFKST